MDAAANSEPTARVIGRPFEKGVSGNPSGRPKAVNDFRDKCREHTDEALATLLEVMRSKSTNTTMPAKVSAARILFAYAFGEPSNMDDETAKAGIIVNILQLATQSAQEALPAVTIRQLATDDA